jgi:hypothetical protein
MSQLLKKPKRRVSRDFDMHWEFVPKGKKVRKEETFTEWFFKNFGGIEIATKYRFTVEVVKSAR